MVPSGSVWSGWFGSCWFGSVSSEYVWFGLAGSHLLGVVLSGLVWFGSVRFASASSALARFDRVLFCLAWFVGSVRLGLFLSGLTAFCLVLVGLVYFRFGSVCFGSAWFGCSWVSFICVLSNSFLA